jgi:hypothetical protein
MRLLDRLGLPDLASDDVEPASVYDAAERIIYMAEIRRAAVVTMKVRRDGGSKEGVILSLRAEPYMRDFRPVSFRLFGWHYWPDDNALSLACAVFEAIRAQSVPNFDELRRRFPLRKDPASIRLVYSRDEDAD